MSIIPITVYGDKILREKAKPVKEVSDELIGKITNMFETMRNAYGIGLAANQVGFRDSLFVIDLSPVEGYEKSKPLVMINPKIVERSDELVVIEEGCLSLPNLRADVERPKSIIVNYLDTDENEKKLEADNFLARVIQHEYDHLLGKMIPDRISIKMKNRLQSYLQRITKREIEIDYPITEN